MPQNNSGVLRSDLSHPTDLMDISVKQTASEARRTIMRAIVIVSRLIVSALSLAPLYAASLSSPLSNKAGLEAPQDGSIVINFSRGSKPQP
jgi:hypothetical protein